MSQHPADKLSLTQLLVALIRGAERLPMPVLVKDDSLRWRYANRAACEAFGIPRTGYQQRSDFDLLDSELAARMTEGARAALGTRGVTESIEHIGERSLRIFRYPLCVGSRPVGLVTVAQEITDLEETRIAFERQRDFYMALSDVNQSIIRAEADQAAVDVYDTVCDVIVQRTSALMAVIARVDYRRGIATFVQQREKSTALPTLRGMEISLDPTHPRGAGPTARAIREKRIVVVNDVEQDPGMAPWRNLHRAHGVKSAIALPVTVDGQQELALIVYAGARGFFSPELINLLREMVDDIGFALRYQRQGERLRHMALMDPPTGLPNRAHFFECVDRIVRAPKAGACALILLDVNDFKFYNNLFGHETGDSLLALTANRVAGLGDDAGVVGRLGSNEFGLFFPYDGDFDPAAQSRRVLGALGTPCDVGWGSPITLSVAGGYALCPLHGVNADALMRRASMALRAVKQEGGHQLRSYVPELEEKLDHRREVHAEIEQALDEGRIEPWFQPQVDLLTGEVVGLEALARLRTVDGRVIAPGWFIDVIEADATLIRRLGLAMLNGVGIRLPQLDAIGLKVPVAVNIGARHLLAPGFQADFEGLLARHPQLTGRIEIEITEAQSLHDLPRAKDVLQRVREHGVGVALDDFGTGYSSVANMRNLPLTLVKLDQDFVRDLPASVEDQAIVSSVVVAARGLGMRLVAEGVETDEHAELLGALGVTLVQGYAISRPLPLAELGRWVSDWQQPANWCSWARPISPQGDALQYLGAWFGLRRWLARPDLGEPQSVSLFRAHLHEASSPDCAPPLSEFRRLFADLSARIADAVATRGTEGVHRREQLLAEVEAMGRMMRRAAGRNSLVG
ncbi:EAL domain-containing protein [Acidihalobacter ferrooxydans]|uniref:Diguanylate cyclase n=1 Tax=Acidihalobacter ferrooxydans TaxID=1765967 RepID=A0A1P8UFZ9_9GAMM|nr:EAL domain-containing protein [Acidihalobacter ferrooxydans]APZ42749.1 hypothetical protein BW247_06285 [Acidihalobacter ferrooxydans]